MTRSCIAWCVVAALDTGCAFHSGRTGTTDATTEFDAPLDAPLDAPPDATTPTVNCFGTSALALVCLESLPTDPLTLGTASSLDTATSPLCAALRVGSSNVCVIAAQTLTISAALTVTGTRPLVLLSLTAITVSATLDIASHRGSPTGAGGDASSCNTGVDPTDRGGGQAGSFGSKGGDGGDSDGALDRGTSGAATMPTTLRGGCMGADGAGSLTSHGNGGGAVLLIAETITISGSINASGSPGDGAPAGRYGGGGAGAGGMIAFDAPTITVSGPVHANGGGGGGGSSVSSAGSPGSEPPVAGGATGGGHGGNGGDGGLGSFGAGAGGSGVSGTTSSDGGGGGGGGAGVILKFRHAGALATSPPAI